MRSLALVLVSILALTGCVTTAQTPVPKGQVAEGSIPYGTFTVPLPPGKWTVISEDRYLNNLNSVLGELTLAEMGEPNTVTRLYSIRTMLAHGANSSGVTASKECERKDFHYVDKRSNSTGQQVCDFVNHYTPSATTAGTSADKVHKELMARNIGIPKNALLSVFTRANTMNFLIVTVVFNPEAEGIPPAQEAAWATTEWNARNVDRFPDRKAYVNKVIAWTKEWSPQISSAFGR